MFKVTKEVERRTQGFKNLVTRFLIEYADALAFLAGWSAYPIGIAMLALLGR